MIDQCVGTQEKLLRFFRLLIIDLPSDVEEINYPTFVPFNCAAIIGALYLAITSTS